MEGMASIRAFGWLQICCNRNYELVDRSQRPYYLLSMVQKWLALVLDLMMACLAVVVVGVAVGLRNTISPGFTGVSLTQIISFTSYLKMMILFCAQMETSLGAVARIKDFSKETEPENSLTNSIQPPSNWPAYGNIEIRGVTAKYR
jgi:ATP-binding cassette, subfamily C (CFTR/MRP), member 1